MRQFQCVPTTYVTEIEETLFQIYTYNVTSIMSIGFAPTVNQFNNTCHFIANCLYLHGSYITKFDFINYAFAKLVVA